MGRLDDAVNGRTPGSRSVLLLDSGCGAVFQWTCGGRIRCGGCDRSDRAERCEPSHGALANTTLGPAGPSASKKRSEGGEHERNCPQGQAESAERAVHPWLKSGTSHALVHACLRRVRGATLLLRRGDDERDDVLASFEAR